MEYRRLGRSGLKISEITYGNWLTHGSQIDEDAATACVHAALDVGITTFDTADVYALGQGRDRARRGARRTASRVAGDLHQGLLAHRPRPNDRGLSRKHIMESSNGSLKRLGTDYVDLYQAHRYDYETPLEETMQAFADLVRQGKVLYIGVCEWKASQIREAVTLQRELGYDRFVSSQPQYSMLWRVIEDRGRPDVPESSGSRRSSGRRWRRAC